MVSVVVGNNERASVKVKAADKNSDNDVNTSSDDEHDETEQKIPKLRPRNRNVFASSMTSHDGGVRQAPVVGLPTQPPVAPTTSKCVQ